MTEPGDDGGAPSQSSSWPRVLGGILLIVGLGLLGGIAILARFASVNDRLARALILDPERKIPEEHVIVAPADGHVLYVRRFEEGTIPFLVKRGVSVPVFELLKASPSRPLKRGYLVGIYMNTNGVHINRVPNTGTLKRQTVYNGPHMNMTEAEVRIVLGQMIPGWTTLRKLLRLDPYSIEKESDYILKSARETLEFEDEDGRAIYVVRIADYFVGNILTWISEGQHVTRGQKLGMITWGSQTDVLFEDTPGLTVVVRAGDYVYGGETVLARP
jgi:phosphatidylserine decarboxylase